MSSAVGSTEDTVLGDPCEVHINGLPGPGFSNTLSRFVTAGSTAAKSSPDLRVPEQRCVSMIVHLTAAEDVGVTAFCRGLVCVALQAKAML